MSRHSDGAKCMRPLDHVDIRRAPPSGVVVAAEPERDRNRIIATDPMIRIDCPSTAAPSPIHHYRSLGRYAESTDYRRHHAGDAFRFHDHQSYVDDDDDDHEYHDIVGDHRDWVQFGPSPAPGGYTFVASTSDRIYENLNRVLSDRRRDHPTARYGKIRSAFNQPQHQTPFDGLATRHQTLHRSLTDHWDHIPYNPPPSKSLSCTGLLQSTENIYENICEQCCAFYTGNECSKCAPSTPSKATQHKLSSTEKLGGFLTGVFSSFRTKKSPPKATKRERVRPSIVHNVDSVFHTNELFELDEISRLKASAALQCIQPPPTTDHSLIYATIRHNESCHTSSTSRNEPQQSCATVKRYSQCKHDIPSDKQQSPQLINSIRATAPAATTTTIYTPASPRPQRTHSESSVSPRPHCAQRRDRVRDVTRLATDSSFVCGRSGGGSVVAWMTSLRWSTQDYVDAVVYNVKLIPTSSLAPCCATIGRPDRHRVAAAATSGHSPEVLVDDDDASNPRVTVRWKDRPDNNSANVERRRWAVNEFRENRVSVRRQAIHVRSTTTTTFSRSSATTTTAAATSTTSSQVADSSPLAVWYVVGENIVNSRASISEQSEASALGVLANDSQVNYTNEVDLMTFPELRTNDITEQIVIYSKPKKRVSRRDRLSQFYLSIGLNRSLVLTADHIQLEWFALRCSSANFEFVGLTAFGWYNAFMAYLIAQSSEQSCSTESTESDRVSSIESIVPVPRSRSSPNLPPVIHRRSKLADFERTAPPVPAPRRAKLLAEYERPHLQRQSPLARRKLEDFIRSDTEPTPTPRLRAPKAEPAPIDPPSAPTVEEDIYQPIWKFSTVGQADDPTCDEEHENYEDADDGNNDDDDNDDDDDHDHDDEHLDHDFSDDSDDEWVVVPEEFQYSIANAKTIDSDIATPFADPYRRVCVLIGPKSDKRNQLLFDLAQPLYTWKAGSSDTLHVDDDGTEFDRSWQKHRQLTRDANNNVPPTDSVLDWQRMMRRADYPDDEEDVNLPGSFKPHHLANEEALENDVETKTILSSNNSVKVVPAVGPATPATAPSDPPMIKRNVFAHMLNKLQSSDRLDIIHAAVSYDKRDEVVGVKFNPTASDFDGNGNVNPQIVFGAFLSELDFNSDMVPQFVVECVRVIEMQENLETSGIYRASGKKESIDKLKDRMNKKKPKKGSKYSSIELEDVHTVTGAFKQFFRELRTELIPKKIVDDLPYNLEAEDSITVIRLAMETLEPHAKATLKFLLRHLIKVHENSAHNMMTASNLSIVWGACLFAMTMHQNDTYDTSDIVRKNTLIKTLILRYSAIFGPDSTEG